MGAYVLSEVDVINKTLQDTLYVRSKFKGGKRKRDLFNLQLFHTINPEGKSVVGVKRSDITYKENVWMINKFNNDLNKITFDDNFRQVNIDSLVLNHDNEFIRFGGVIRDSTYKDLRLQFTDVNFNNIGPDIDSLKLDGVVNGNLNFLQKKGAYYPNSSVTIDGVTVNDIPFGDLNMNITGNRDLTNYRINTTLVNEGIKSINAVGSIDVSGEESSIDLNVDLEIGRVHVGQGDDTLTQRVLQAGGPQIRRAAGIATEGRHVFALILQSEQTDALRIDVDHHGVQVPVSQCPYQGAAGLVVLLRQ